MEIIMDAARSNGFKWWNKLHCGFIQIAVYPPQILWFIAITNLKIGKSLAIINISYIYPIYNLYIGESRKKNKWKKNSK